MELYHGDGSFLKVYPRDVSRGFDGGKINFVIYAKPSVLQFTNSNSSLEREVNCNMIEPLVIKDITIKAKKRDWSLFSPHNYTILISIRLCFIVIMRLVSLVLQNKKG